MKYLIGLLLLGLVIIAGCAGTQKTEPTTQPTVPEEPATAPVTEPTTQPTVEKEPTKTVEVKDSETQPAEDTTTAPSTASDVTILGKEGVDPMTLLKKKGDTVKWLNNDPKKKKVTLTSKEKQTKKYNLTK